MDDMLTRDVAADDGQTGYERVPPPPPKGRQPAKARMKEDVFTLKEGDVVLQWPERLSSDGFEDLETWVTLMLRKIKREAVDVPEATAPNRSRPANPLIADLEDNED